MVSWKTVTVPVVLFNFSVRFAHNFSPKGITNRAALTVCTSESGIYNLNAIVFNAL